MLDGEPDAVEYRLRNSAAVLLRAIYLIIVLSDLVLHKHF